MAAFLFFYFGVMLISTIHTLQNSKNLLTTILGHCEPYQELFLLESQTDEASQVLRNLSSFFSSVYFNQSNSFIAKDSNNSYKQNFYEGIRKIFESTDNVAIIVNVQSEEGIYQILHTIGENVKNLRTIRRIWTVIIWPKVILNLTEIKTFQSSNIFSRVTIPFRVNSQLFFAFNFAKEKGSTEVALYEAYHAGDTARLSHLDRGIFQWNCHFCEGLSIRRFNFHHRVLKVTAVNDSEVNDDIHVYVDSRGKVSYSKNGFSGTILEILQNLLNFTLEPVVFIAEPMLAKEFGVPIPKTDRWSGSIGDLVAGRADLAISITIFQPNRAQVVSFLPPADEHLINALFKPPAQSQVRDIFAQPFAAELWAVVLTTWIVLACCMVLFSTIRKKYDMDEICEDENDLPEPDFPRDSFMWAIGTVCQQGWEDHPKATSLRAIFLSGSFTGVVAYAGYSAAIVSTLSTTVDPIKTPLELLKSNLDVGIRSGFISSLLEQNKTQDTMSRFYKRVEHSPEKSRYLNISSGLHRLQNHPYAFITTRDTIYDLLKTTTDDKTICEIKDLEILKNGFPLGYPIPKFSPYREILRYAMIMIREPGILFRLRQKYTFQRRCLDKSSSAGNALGATDVFTAFMILCAGFGLSLMFLFIERIICVRMRFKYIR